MREDYTDFCIDIFPSGTVSFDRSIVYSASDQDAEFEGNRARGKGRGGENRMLTLCPRGSDRTDDVAGNDYPCTFLNIGGETAYLVRNYTTGSECCQFRYVPGDIAACPPRACLLTPHAHPFALCTAREAGTRLLPTFSPTPSWSRTARA